VPTATQGSGRRSLRVLLLRQPLCARARQQLLIPPIRLPWDTRHREGGGVASGPNRHDGITPKRRARSKRRSSSALAVSISTGKLGALSLSRRVFSLISARSAICDAMHSARRRVALRFHMGCRRTACSAPVASAHPDGPGPVSLDIGHAPCASAALCELCDYRSPIHALPLSPIQQPRHTQSATAARPVRVSNDPTSGT
jgi:hypothetical protein